MFKKIFQNIFFLITQPAKAWHLLSEDDWEQEKFFSNYLYPIFGIITLFAFLGAFRINFSIESGLKEAISEFISFFVGFYLSSFLMFESMDRMFEKTSMKKCRYFVAYASSLIYIISMIVSLLNGFELLYLVLPYTIYIVWEGAISYMRVSEENQLKFTIIASLIVFIPYVISFIIHKFMLTVPVHATIS